MIYITGDTHGNFKKIFDFLNNNKFNEQKQKENKYLIILGDCGINYYLDERDSKIKKELSKLPIKFICIHGNHEERPQNIKTYKLINIDNEEIKGNFFYEQEYPNILFPAIGEIFSINNHNFLHLGGAYSVDKYNRIRLNALGFKNIKWFASEQLTINEKQKILNLITLSSFLIYDKDLIILSHTCPLKYIPKQQTIDFNDVKMEEFLDQIETILNYKSWYCGHWHIDYKIDRINFLYNNIIALK